MFPGNVAAAPVVADSPAKVIPMLVTFKSSSHGDITLFGSVAKSLLKMMGQSGQVPGAVMADDVVAAKNALTQSLDALESTDDDDQASAKNNDEGEAPVALSTRAIPLLAMLDSAAENGDNVMWE